ncbi:indole-3-glycerol phosphate synthase TrpC [Paenibacillus sp. UMB4589-SE434]|uniref:indole-3-glycerol phosphate synthase TrpC n=1 Tax=Paenibacillus sp. UMB4589-SE434 TaxID=3046314 RepID=UPI002549E734|nr:indole-3-glycerol phosphate synthase TrpC [Paenibacillus sp. UMB4589-SE434]MDK8179492.1 indole-3-glycerol phosphate synthase TrpC [Paenibacillus sp. UMB4589-SE434]
MFLNRIVATKQEEVANLRKTMNRHEVEQAAASMPAVRSLKAALTAQRKRAIGLIAEVKKASPSKGLIRADFDPVAIARDYVGAGADALSVLTDVSYFQGGIDIFKRVRAEVQVPLLRKEFIISEEQLLEARVIGADAVLLIAAILNDDELKHLHQFTRELGMEALVEVHDEAELARVNALENVELVGINNRNLHTFVTDLKQTEKLRPLVPEGRVLISESGIHLPEHLAALAEQHVDAVLIGEHFMRQGEVGAAVNDLMSGVENASEQINS